VRVPLRGAYRGFEIVTMPPSSAGGVALLQMLNILERHDRSSMTSLASIHLAVEAMRRAFADRWQHLGDPAFLSIDTDRLAGKEHAAELDRSIDPLRATPSDRLLPVLHPPREGEQTTHYSVVDRWGNAVSVTTTLNSICGGKCVVEGAGFLLNNEMDDFTIKPGEPNQFGLIGSDVNRIEPGKRMLSSMTPAIILREGVPVLVLGSPGGSTIPTAVLQVCLNVLDASMPLDRAVAARRYHHQWMPDTLFHEPRAWDAATGEALRAMGHRVKERPAIGRVDAVLYDARKKLYYGCSDPRGHGAAVAW
jgi:gamma-glutamyltranspeptidase/glutathione hydrolase